MPNFRGSIDSGMTQLLEFLFKVLDGTSPKQFLYARENSPKCQNPQFMVTSVTVVEPHFISRTGKASSSNNSDQLRFVSIACNLVDNNRMYIYADQSMR